MQTEISHKSTWQMVERMLEETGFTPIGRYTDEGRLFGIALGGTGVCSEEMFGEGYLQKMAVYFAWGALGYLPTRYLHIFSMVRRHIGIDLTNWDYTGGLLALMRGSISLLASPRDAPQSATAIHYSVSRS